MLAGYLQEKCDITAFIDSEVWGYSDDLLKKIDHEFCNPYKNEVGEEVYDYNRRNRSTALVHLILQGALAKMINRCECMIFIGSPNSLRPSDIKDENLTYSPWIYSELLMANSFPPRIPERYKPIRHDSFCNESQNFIPDLKVNLETFRTLSISDIDDVVKNPTNPSPEEVLDQLYLDKGILRYSDQLYG